MAVSEVTYPIIDIVDNLFVRMFVLEHRGDRTSTHAHKFSHITLLAKGSVRRVCKSDAGESVEEHRAPVLMRTPKGVVHEFEALSDDCLLCCINAIRCSDDVDDIAPQDISHAAARELLLTVQT